MRATNWMLNACCWGVVGRGLSGSFGLKGWLGKWWHGTNKGKACQCLARAGTRGHCANRGCLLGGCVRTFTGRQQTGIGKTSAQPYLGYFLYQMYSNRPEFESENYQRM